MEQKDGANITRELNWEEYRNFGGFSATPYTDTPPIAGTSPAPRNTFLVLHSPRIYMPVRPPIRGLAHKVQIGVIKSANVVTRSKPTGSGHTTTENIPIVASSVAVSPSAPPQVISSGPITPFAFGPISTCTTRTQYLGLELAKQYRECKYHHQQHLMLHRQAITALCASILQILMSSSQIKCLVQARQEALGKVPKLNIYTSTHQLEHFHPNNCRPIPSSAFYFQKPQDSCHLGADNDVCPRPEKEQPTGLPTSRGSETQTTSGYT